MIRLFFTLVGVLVLYAPGALAKDVFSRTGDLLQTISCEAYKNVRAREKEPPDEFFYRGQSEFEYKITFYPGWKSSLDDIDHIVSHRRYSSSSPVHARTYRGQFWRFGEDGKRAIEVGIGSPDYTAAGGGKKKLHKGWVQTFFFDCIPGD